MGIFQQATLTNLRGLKYGNDTIGGGNSGEPYITTPIPPALDQQADPNDAIGIDGGLIRGGFTGATNASEKDFIRIGKFLKDAPQGPRFITKQIGLQLSNPQLEAPLGSPLTNLLQGNFSTLLGGGDNFNANIGTTRIYNGGINTLLQVPVNAFGGHIVRHGLLPIESTSAKYENVAFNNDQSEPEGKNNRLVRLKAKLENNPNANIAQYVSGPGSIDGIGITTIPRFNFTLNNGQYLPLTDKLEIDQEGIILNNLVPIDNNGYLYAPANPNYYNAQGVSLQYLDNNAALIEANNNVLPFTQGRENNATQNSQFGQDVINYGTAKNYTALQKAIDDQTSTNRIGTAYVNKSTDNDLGPGTINNKNTVTSPIIFNVTGRSKYKNLDLKTFNIGTRLGLAQSSGSYAYDEVNLTPLYYSDSAPGSSYINIPGKGRPTKIRDLIKFRIEAVDNDSPTNSVWMIFRSYLKDITDTPNPSWNTVNYVGRGEPFYIYKGFERNISFTLQVAAMSEAELKPMWQKLNYLYSNTMPDYGESGVMRGPYMKLTLGDYMFRQPGVIKNLTYTIGNDSPWEIALDEPENGGNLYELPHVMTIQMTFAPIHDFVPRKFPFTLNQVKDSAGNLVDDWKNLPAFMADRQSNQNEWLTNIFGDDNKIPKGENSDGIPPALQTTSVGLAPLQGAAINAPLFPETPFDNSMLFKAPNPFVSANN
jgi:hypothetical protein